MMTVQECGVPEFRRHWIFVPLSVVKRRSNEENKIYQLKMMYRRTLQSDIHSELMEIELKIIKFSGK